MRRREFLLGAVAVAGCSSVLSTKYPLAARCELAGCLMVDVHCHVFNATDLNIKGFVTYTIPVPHKLTAGLVGKFRDLVEHYAPSAAQEAAELRAFLATGTEPPDRPAPLDDDLKAIAGNLALSTIVSLSPSANDVAQTVRLVAQSRLRIAKTIAQTYTQIDLFTPALVDFEYWTDDHAKSPLSDQLEVHSLLSRCSMKGKLDPAGRVRLHSFAPFNPLREVKEAMSADTPYQPLGPSVANGAPYGCDLPIPTLNAETKGALPRLRNAIESLGFIGAKVYPPTGFLPIGNENSPIHGYVDTGRGKQLDDALRALYAYCQAEDVPLTTHANNSNGYDLGYGLLTGPELWGDVLKQFPNLRLNFGHFGELEGDDGSRGIEACELWMRQIAQLMHQYPNVYADSAASLLPVESKYQTRYLSLLGELFEQYPVARKRFMYGSDYWLNTFVANSGTFVNAFAKVFDDNYPGLHQDFFGGNALRFLGLLDDQGRKPSSRNRSRLLAFYKGETVPSWLANSSPA